MIQQIRLKPIKNSPTNELSAFINTVYDSFIHQIKNYEDTLKNEKEPLHYLLIQNRLEETKNALKMFEKIVDDLTEYDDDMKDFETFITIKDCINLLSTDGKGTKQQVKQKLEELLK